MTTSVYISNEIIQITMGRLKSGKIVVEKYYSTPLEANCIIGGVITDSSVLSAHITGFWKKYALPTSKVHLIVDSSSVSVKKMLLPRLSLPKLEQLVINDYSEFDGETQRIYDFTVIDEKNSEGGVTLLACATEDDFIASYVELFESCGISIEKIDIGVNCQISLVKRIKLLSDKTFILAVMDGNTISTTLFVNGKYSFSNRSRIVAERGSSEIIEEIMRKISSIVQFNKSEKTGFEITDCFFGGLSFSEINMCEFLSSALMMNIAVFPDFPEINILHNKNQNDVIFHSSDCIYALGNLAE